MPLLDIHTFITMSCPPALEGKRAVGLQPFRRDPPKSTTPGILPEFLARWTSPSQKTASPVPAIRLHWSLSPETQLPDRDGQHVIKQEVQDVISQEFKEYCKSLEPSKKSMSPELTDEEYARQFKGFEQRARTSKALSGGYVVEVLESVKDFENFCSDPWGYVKGRRATSSNESEQPEGSGVTSTLPGHPEQPRRRDIGAAEREQPESTRDTTPGDSDHFESRNTKLQDESKPPEGMLGRRWWTESDEDAKTDVGDSVDEGQTEITIPDVETEDLASTSGREGTEASCRSMTLRRRAV